MSRLVTCGWETGDLNEIGAAGGAGTQAVVSATPTPRAPGTYCIRFGTTTPNSSYRDITLGAPKTDVWVRQAVFLHGLLFESIFLQIFDSGGSIQGSVSWSPDQLLRAYRSTSVLLGTSAQPLPLDGWHTVEVRWQITSATVGIVEVWVDGSRWLNLTGVDNTQSSDPTIQSVRIGVPQNVLGTAVYLAVDDLAINDTVGSLNNGRIGDGRVVLLTPTGAGSTTGLTRGGTDTGANWSQTSELPPSMTQYVASATVGALDTYAASDPSLPSGAWGVNCVEVIAYAQNSDATGGSLAPTLKSGATTTEGTAQPLTTSPGYVRSTFDTDPNTGAAWTVAAVNALEPGVTVR